MVRHSKSAALFSLVALFGCDKISPFISQEEYDERIDLDGDGVPNSDDCDPKDKTITRYSFYRDLDEDGFGSIKENQTGCKKVAGLVEKGGDCNDANDKIYPGAVEVCDQFDNDCDSETDEGVVPRWYRDKDEDTFGNPNDFRDDCIQPDGYTSDFSDCDDSSVNVYPNATEICDTQDNDCDGDTDEDLAIRWYRDKDKDTYGDVNVFEDTCAQPTGYVSTSDDCNDTTSTVNPGATEICDDKIDQDCNGTIDDAEKAKLWFADEDGDGSGNPAISLFACAKPDRHVLSNDDCDDTNSSANPNLLETCQDEIDNDCDGTTDTDAVYVTWYRDEDKDGFGNSGDSTTSCAPLLDGYTNNNEDCYDESDAINPSVEEVCNNGIDDNCDEDVNQCKLSSEIKLSFADTTLIGENEDDNAGWSVAGLGDINQDGVNDLAIGAPGTETGTAYVMFGPIVNGTQSLSTAPVKLLGETDADNAGWSVAGLGDINQDGVNDLAIGAPGTETGTAYVMFGPIADGVQSLSTAPVKLLGETDADNAGWSVAGLGDVNQDGVNDLAIGAPGTETGTAYVMFGPIVPSDKSLAFADVKIVGEKTGDKAGWSISPAGDINGDQIEDLVIGAPFTGPGGIIGTAYVIFGPLIKGEFNLSSADVKITGESTGDNAGWSVAPAGDLNGDQMDDLIVSAPGESSELASAGAVYVLFGPLAKGELSLSSADVKITGESIGDNAGWSVASSGDLNGDQINDLMIGATSEDSETDRTGTAYIMFGPFGPSKLTLSAANVKIPGNNIGDQTGCSISIDDLTNDGYQDIIVAAYKTDDSGVNAGSVFLIPGLGL